jgi:aminopeptidase
MIHPIYHQLAQNLVGFSTRIQPGERVLIDISGVPIEMGQALIQAVRERQAHPYIQYSDGQLSREYLASSDPEAFALHADWELQRMKSIDAYIAIRGGNNIFEQSDIGEAALKAWMTAMKPILDWRVQKTKWVILRWPTPGMAQQAGMSTPAFEEFFFDVCTLDYSRMEAGMAALKALMEKTDQVHITGPGTDLKFSIKGISAIPCGGQYNIPDGEVFTAPVRDSVEGTITYNAPTVYQGTPFDQVKLVFSKGKIVEATANNTQRLNEILDTDDGARYVGEFALGFNPYILDPIRDILFDEKIAGSFHFTPGQAYEDADNGNRSQIHWDLVNIQRPEYGGGEIHFDSQLIRKDGLFIGEGIELLNPAHLLGL